MENSKIKQTFNTIGNIIITLVLISVLLSGYFILKNKASGDVPNVLGYKLYVVLSGSMEKAIPTGSLVAVQKTEVKKLVSGDVITFNQIDNSKTVTHRIVKIENIDGILNFTTKGDANDTNDIGIVKSDNIIGKFKFSIPFAGSVLQFVKTKNGILVLLIIPGILLFLIESKKLFKNVSEYERKKEIEKSNKQINE